MLRKKKVLAGGAFNILHPGHLYFLQEAKKLGGSLIVVVASDNTVRKNNKKLLHPAHYRAERIGALSFVDKVVIGDDDDMMKVVIQERPSVIAIGYDQDEEGLRKQMDAAGIECRIVRIERLKDYSTKKIMEGNQ